MCRELGVGGPLGPIVVRSERSEFLPMCFCLSPVMEVGRLAGLGTISGKLMPSFSPVESSSERSR